MKYLLLGLLILVGCGDDGRNGINGRDGCNTYTELGDGGIAIMCGNDQVGFIPDSIDGEDGVDGLAGVDGNDGENGLDGQNGLKGDIGLTGQDGLDGQDGVDTSTSEMILFCEKYPNRKSLINDSYILRINNKYYGQLLVDLSSGHVIGGSDRGRQLLVENVEYKPADGLRITTSNTITIYQKFHINEGIIIYNLSEFSL